MNNFETIKHYPKGSEAEKVNNNNQALRVLFKNIKETKNGSSINKLFSNLDIKKIKIETKKKLSILKKEIDNKEKININKYIKKIVERNLEGKNTQKHAEKGLKNYLNLPEKTKENLGKLIKIFNNIDWGVIGGLGIKESKFETNAKSSKGAKGIFQVKIFEDLKKHYNSTNKYKGPEEKFLSDLKNNKDFVKIYNEMPREALGIAFLSYLINKYNGDLIKAFGYYNSGQDKYSKWGKETKEYVYGPKSVLKYGKVFYLAQAHLNR